MITYPSHVPKISYVSNDVSLTKIYYTSYDDRKGHDYMKVSASHPITSSTKYHSKNNFHHHDNHPSTSFTSQSSKNHIASHDTKSTSPIYASYY